MNKEITYLKNGTVEIVDEFGNINKRLNEDKIEEILVNENKLEHLEKIIKDIIYELEECKKFDYNCNKLFKFVPVSMILHIIITLILGSPIFASLLGSVIFGLIGSGIIKLAKGYSRKSKKGLCAKLDFANKLKHEYQEELNESIITSSILEDDKILETKIVPIKNSERLEQCLIDEMNNVYIEAYNNEKFLVRTRKK